MSTGMASTTLSQIYYVFVSDLLATGHDNLARHQSHTSFTGRMLIAFYLAVMIFRICHFAADSGRMAECDYSSFLSTDEYVHNTNWPFLGGLRSSCGFTMVKTKVLFSAFFGPERYSKLCVYKSQDCQYLGEVTSAGLQLQPIMVFGFAIIFADLTLTFGD
ncbi:hypothetical protein Tco_0537826 [Tanacetum coccineum]